MNRLPYSLALLAAVICLPVSARAVVVAGANGGADNSNNTTQSQLESSLGVSNANWYGNVFQNSDASGVYLGYASTVNGLRAYALTAVHISDASTVMIDGIMYMVESRSQIGSSELEVLTLTQADDLMPALPALTLATASPVANTQTVMVGYGYNRLQNATTSATVPDSVTVPGGTGYTTGTTQYERWGTNNVRNLGLGNTTTTLDFNGNSTTVFETTFTQPGSNGWLTSNEAQAVTGDSGGGVFSTSGTLMGLMVAVSNSGTNPAFNDQTYIIDIATYKTQIDEAIGATLIPEPSTYGLLAGGAALLGGFRFFRRKRK